MRKMKFFMPFGVVVMAAGLAFASSGQSENLETLYIQLPGECRQVNTVCNNIGATCMYEGQEVFGKRDNPTKCSIDLKHQP